MQTLSVEELAQWTPIRRREFAQRYPHSWPKVKQRLEMAAIFFGLGGSGKLARRLAHMAFDRDRHHEAIRKTLCARERLRVIVRRAPRRTGIVKSIITLAAEATGVEVNEVLGPRRTKRVAMARQVAAALLRKHTGLSCAEVGRKIGGRDHSTVMHAEAVVKEDLSKGGKRFGALIAYVEERL